MKLPGPDHPITITANPHRLRVMFGGKVVAETSRALTLKEASYPAVQYIPREDANMSLFARTEHATQCPYKGQASYYTLRVDGRAAETLESYVQGGGGVAIFAGADVDIRHYNQALYKDSKGILPAPLGIETTLPPASLTKWR